VPDATAFLIAPRETSVRYSVEHHPDLFGDEVLVIRPNADGAEDFKIAWTPLRAPGREHWRDLVPHRPGVYLLHFALLRDWLVRLEREDGLPGIVVREVGTSEEHAIAFSREGYSLSMEIDFHFAHDLLRFTCS